MTEPTPLNANDAALSDALWRRVLRNPVAVAALVYLLIVVLAAIFAPLLSPYDPNQASFDDILAPPSSEHLLGTDSSGRDVLARLLYGARFTLAGAALAVIVAVIIGVLGGLIAGYVGGWFDAVSSWLAGLLMALPGIVVLLAVRAAVGPSMWVAMAVFGLLLSPLFFRLVYSAVRAVRGELYVDAARVSGLSDTRIIGRHILFVVRPPVIIQIAMVAGIAIAIQSGLEFLGLADPQTPTWGAMLQDGFTKMYVAPALMLWPALAIALTCLAMALLGNGLRDAVERSTTRRPRRVGTRPNVAGDAPSEPVERHEDVSAAFPQDALLSVRGLAIGYDLGKDQTKQVVSDVSIDVARGEVHGLIGESGSGKTQTAYAVLGLIPQGGRVLAGSILFDGCELVGMSEPEMRSLRGKKIAYVPQEPMSNLDPAYRIGDQLTESVRVVLRVSKADAKQRVLSLLARVGIADPARVFRSYPHEISGGMAQRVLIAGAISGEPDLLIADEPTTALDVTVQAEVLDLLRSLQEEMNMGMILVTHNFGVVADICDRVTVMRNGRVVETGPVRSIFQSPRHPYTRSLFEAIITDTRPADPYQPPTFVAVAADAGAARSAT